MNKLQLAMIGSMLCLSCCQNDYFKDINLFNHEILSTKKQEPRFDVREISSNKKEETRFEFIDPETDWDITVGVTTKDQVVSKLKSENLQYELRTSKNNDILVLWIEVSAQQYVELAFEQNRLLSIYIVFKGGLIKQLKKLEQSKGTYFKDSYWENKNREYKGESIIELGERNDMSSVGLLKNNEENITLYQVLSNRALELEVKKWAEQEKKKKDFLKRMDKIYNDTLNGKK